MALLRLPAELRNMIYKFVLADDPLSWYHFRKTSFKRSQPSLLRVCKQIRIEATGLYYGTNAFSTCVHEFDFVNLARRLDNVAKSGHPTFTNLKVTVRRPELEQLEGVFDLVTVIARTGLDLNGGGTVQIWDCHHTVVSMLDEALVIGMDGYRYSWTQHQLEYEFLKWVDEIVDPS